MNAFVSFDTQVSQNSDKVLDGKNAAAANGSHLEGPAISTLEHELSMIASQTPTVETLADNSYADIALERLTQLAEKAIALYRNNNPQIGSSSTKELEDSAFQNLGLREVTDYLDSIIQLGDQLRALDALLLSKELIVQIKAVFVPPDKLDQQSLAAGDGSFTEKTNIQRTKAVLFILQQNFGIDVTDGEQLEISEGVLDQSMMRKQTYYLLEVSELNRLILINNEEGNASFVIDTELMQEARVTKEMIRNEMTKQQLRLLIDQHPTLGQRIIYSSAFIQNMIAAIEQPSTKSREQRAPERGTNYLVQGARKERFDWGPIREEGIEGFVRVAKSRGLLGRPNKDVRTRDTGFYVAFKKWLQTLPEALRTENQNRVYAPSELIDWDPIRKEGIEGFVRVAQERGLLGLPAHKVREADPAFDGAFSKWLRTLPKALQTENRDRVYARSEHVNWAPIREEGIEGFVRVAQEKGLLGLPAHKVREVDATFYWAFSKWLQTLPKALQTENRDRVYARSEHVDWGPIRAGGINAFVEEAKRKGIFGLSSTEVQQRNPGFRTAFSIWLAQQPPLERDGYYNQVYKRKNKLDLSRLREQGIEAFVEEAKQRNIAGLSPSEVKRLHSGLYAAFQEWLKEQPEEMRPKHRVSFYAYNEKGE